MNEFRITLLSDPTDEFPNNQNNTFKVRLPNLINYLEKIGRLVCGDYRCLMKDTAIKLFHPRQIQSWWDIDIPLHNIIKRVM